MLGLNPEQLARRAVLAGAYDTALQEADLILEVASDNAIAWIVGLLAADRMRDESRFLSLLNRAPLATIGKDDILRDLLLDLVQSRAAVGLVLDSPNLR